ncbi:hypothetical protein [Nocardia thailandica]|uniref:hypothetical protein n=1 Tax=Nocardia thailandica TaxID=257275 RepID=UPI0002DEC0A6|nr:hypothetical protein [Nocardia thailandica]
MNEIDYVFGTGDGTVTTWSGIADLSLADPAVPDAIWLDFDGAGPPDDALWDSDRDGVADVAALDTDGDGVLDHFYTDPDGLGTWSHRVTGAPADASAEPLPWTVRGPDGALSAPRADPAPATSSPGASAPGPVSCLTTEVPLVPVDLRTAAPPLPTETGAPPPAPTSAPDRPPA